MSGIPTNRTAGGQVTWEGDLVPPVTSYAASVRQSPLFSGLNVPASANSTRSAVVNRRDLRKGLLYFYAHGGDVMPLPQVTNPPGGGVRLSAFQQVLVTLHDWVINEGLFMAGYPRNLGYSFRTPQLKTQVSGGSGPGMMAQRPLFPGVQTVPRYTAPVRRYSTKGARS